MTVERVRIGDVLELHRRPVEVEPEATYAEIGVRSFGRGIFHKEPVLGADLGKKRVFYVEAGDLVISNVFAWEGAVAVAGTGDAGRVGSHRFMTFRPRDRGRVDVRWLASFLSSEPGLERLQRASPGSAGRNRTLAIKRFEALEIPLPPLDEQRSIAERFDQIARARTRMVSLRMRTEHLLEALPYSVAAEAESMYKMAQVRLGDVLVRHRVPVPIDPTQRYETLGVRSFGRGVLRYPPRLGGEIGKLRFFEVPSDHLIISNIKAWEGAVAATDASLTSTVASNRFLMYRPRGGRDQLEYFAYLLSSDRGVAALSAASPGSADRNRTLSVARFEDIELSMPAQATDRERVAAAIRSAVEFTHPARSLQASARHHVTALEGAALNAAFVRFR